MIQATTPTLTLTLPSSVNLENATNVVFTIEQDGLAVSKDLSNGVIVDANVASVYLAQADTIDFLKDRKAKIQLNWTHPGGLRAATKIKEIDIDENLFKEVIE